MTRSGRQKRLSLDSAALWLAENVCRDIVFNELGEHPIVQMVAHMFGCSTFDIAVEVTRSHLWPDSRKRKAREIRVKAHI